MGFVINHVGQCVTDVDRSRRFYEDVLGFEFWREIAPPDEMTAQLIDLEPPLGVRAVYLRRDEFVLELIHYSEAGSHTCRCRSTTSRRPRRRRSNAAAACSSRRTSGSRS